MFSKPSSDRVGRVWREGGRLVIEYADPRLAESAVNEIRSGRFPPLPNVAVREARRPRTEQPPGRGEVHRSEPALTDYRRRRRRDARLAAEHADV